MSKGHYLAAAVIGAVVGLGTGYAVFALSWKGAHVGLVDWTMGTLVPGFFVDAMTWAIMGAGLAAAVAFFVKRPN